MKTLHALFFLSFLPVLLVSTAFFTMILQLVDLFSNLWRYINLEVPPADVVKIAILYIPKCISFSLPISLLFSVAYVLGTAYSHNELIAIFGSGISLYRLIIPFLLFSIMLSAGNTFFENRVVVPTFREKENLTKTVLGQIESYNNSQVTIIDNLGKLVYYAGFYNDETKTLSDITIIVLDDNHSFLKRLEADRGKWDSSSNSWEWENVRLFERTIENSIDLTFFARFNSDEFSTEPDTFRNIVKDVNEMSYQQAREWIAFLKKTGLPYKVALTDLYERFFFSFTPLIVILLSCAVGGRFKKNILLMSLLMSLLLGVIYYVLRMVTTLMSKQGLLPPIIGAGSAFFLYLAFSITLLRKAKT